MTSPLFDPPPHSNPIFKDDLENNSFWNMTTVLACIIFAIALILRISQFFFLSANDPSFDHILADLDTEVYENLSQSILQGDWLLESTPIHSMGPLYTYFLALIYGAFGHHYEIAHATQYLLGACSAVIVFLAARQWFSNRVAFVAGLFPALSSTLIVYEGYLLPEAMIFFLASFFVWIMGLAHHRSNRWWIWLLIGFLLGLTSIQRANFLLCGLGIIFWIFSLPRNQGQSRKLLQLGLFISGILIALAPTALHNRIYGGQWVLVTSNGPANIYIGNSSESQGTFGYGPNFQNRAAEVSTGNASWTGLLAKEISEDPLRWCKLMLKKGYLYWAAYDPPDNFNYELQKSFSPITAFGQLPYYLIATLGFIGMVAAWPRRKYLLELYLFVFFCMVSVTVFFVSGRFRLPVMIPMSIFAAIAIWKIAAWIQSKAWLHVTAAATASLITIYALKFYSLDPLPVRMEDYQNLAQYYELDRQPDKAITTLQDAIKKFEEFEQGNEYYENLRSVSLFYGREDLGKRLARDGKLEEARIVFEQQINTGMYNESFALELAKIYIQLGEYRRATVLARQALHRNPQSIQLVTILNQAGAYE